MVGVHVLDQHPRRPRRAERTLDPRGLELLRHRLDLVPRRRRLVRETRLLEVVLVVVEDRRRRVERHRGELPARRVVTLHGPDQVVPVDRELVVTHELVHRVHRARRQHGLGADFEHLNDVRRLLRPIGRDRGVEGLRIRPFVHRLHDVVALRGIELGGDLVDPLVQHARHGVPELDLRRGDRRRWESSDEHRRRDENAQRRARHEDLHYGLLVCCGFGAAL